MAEVSGTVPKLLERELTSDERIIQTELKSALHHYGRVQLGRATVRELAARQPEPFFAAALNLLHAETDPGVRRNMYSQLVECPEFLIQLMRPDRFGREELVDVCRELMGVDHLLDVRLARLAPGRQGDGCPVASATVIRVLDVLDEISPGPRLVIILNHLTRHPEERIAAKATLLLARRVRNDSWVETHLASTDARSRASVVEALWGVDTLAARRIMLNATKDTNNRVVGNGVLGLHLLGDRRAAVLVREMIVDERAPFRWTGAWVMGKMGNPEFVALLERAARDPEPGVQTAALRALDAIRKPVPVSEPEPAAESRPEAEAVEPQAAEPETKAAPEAQPPAPEAETKPEVPPAAEPPRPDTPDRPEEPEEAPLDFDLRLDGSFTSSRRRK